MLQDEDSGTSELLRPDRSRHPSWWGQYSTDGDKHLFQRDDAGIALAVFHQHKVLVLRVALPGGNVYDQRFEGRLGSRALGDESSKCRRREVERRAQKMVGRAAVGCWP